VCKPGTEQAIITDPTCLQLTPLTSDQPHLPPIGPTCPQSTPLASNWPHLPPINPLVSDHPHSPTYDQSHLPTYDPTNSPSTGLQRWFKAIHHLLYNVPRIPIHHQSLIQAKTTQQLHHHDDNLSISFLLMTPHKSSPPSITSTHSCSLHPAAA